MPFLTVLLIIASRNIGLQDCLPYAELLVQRDIMHCLNNSVSQHLCHSHNYSFTHEPFLSQAFLAIVIVLLIAQFQDHEHRYTFTAIS
jgi:hypothetical protein